MEQKVLVCITIQENSRRLISTGANVAQSLDAPLHILHIRKGETIFDNPDSSSLLENLFAYGSELGGEVHFLCSNDITMTIVEFIINNQITHLVLGEAPSDLKQQGILSIDEKLKSNLPSLQISVLSRDSSTLQVIDTKKELAAMQNQS